jgi:hypothetical protein
MAAMPSSVHIVTSGEYDDFKIEAVFGSFKDAKDFVNGSDLFSIASWPIRKRSGRKVRKLFGAQIDLETGCAALHYGKYGHEPKDRICPKRWSRAALSNYFPDETNSRACVIGESTISQSHALKAAAKYRQSLLQEKALAGKA